jgi:formate hydrogenlyase subunit 3/multisubunit Na+/H+ antiporter MnhD subunit
MNPWLALVAAFFTLTGLIGLIFFWYGLYFEATQCRGLSRQAAQAKMKADNLFQALFFLVKAVAVCYIWPVMLYRQLEWMCSRFFLRRQITREQMARPGVIGVRWSVDADGIDRCTVLIRGEAEEVGEEP